MLAISLNSSNLHHRDDARRARELRSRPDRGRHRPVAAAPAIWQTVILAPALPPHLPVLGQRDDDRCEGHRLSRSSRWSTCCAHAQQIASATYRPFETLAGADLVFLAMNLVVSLGGLAAEARLSARHTLNHDLRSRPPADPLPAAPRRRGVADAPGRRRAFVLGYLLGIVLALVAHRPRPGAAAGGGGGRHGAARHPVILILLPGLLRIAVLGRAPAGVLVGTVALALFAGALLRRDHPGGDPRPARGQFESARAIGMSPLQAMRHVIAPQIPARAGPPRPT